MGVSRGGNRHRAIRAVDADAALQPFDAGERAAGRVVARGDQRPGDHQFEVQPRRCGAGHFGERGVQDVCGAGQLGGTELVGLYGHPVEFVLRHSAEHGRGARGRGRGDDDEVAHPFEEILDEAARVLAGLDHPVDGVEGA